MSSEDGWVGVSRRRLAFKATAPEPTPTPIKQAPPPQPAEEKHVKTKKPWNFHELMLFYEAVKQYGKDMDGVHKYMVKKKATKDKEQIKNFYFNTFKLIRAAIKLDEDSLGADIPRDAKELFVLINGCEWKKRTENEKYVPDRLKELIFGGTTTTRLRRKKQSIVIRTPLCPALLKFFTHDRKIDRFPTSVTLSITPRTYSDASSVLGVHQNPNIRLRLLTTDRVSRVFDVLAAKWIHPSARAVDGAPAAPISVRLFPSPSTEIGSAVLTPGNNFTMSLDRLKQDRGRWQPTHPIRAKHSDISVAGVASESYSLQVPPSTCPFVLSPSLLQNGLTVSDVRDASMAELYCLCGMTPLISMVFSVDRSDSSSHLWGILSDLVSRDYPDSLRKKNIRPVMVRPSRPPRVNSPPPRVNSPPTVKESKVVDEENDAFEEQLRSLAKKRRKCAPPFRAARSNDPPAPRVYLVQPDAPGPSGQPPSSPFHFSHMPAIPDISPLKSSSLEGYVNVSVDQMLSENSNDYYMSFRDLVSHHEDITRL